jgi:hypothetical protein
MKCRSLRKYLYKRYGGVIGVDTDMAYFRGRESREKG